MSQCFIEIAAKVLFRSERRSTLLREDDLRLRILPAEHRYSFIWVYRGSSSTDKHPSSNCRFAGEKPTPY